MADHGKTGTLGRPCKAKQDLTEWARQLTQHPPSLRQVKRGLGQLLPQKPRLVPAQEGVFICSSPEESIENTSRVELALQAINGGTTIQERHISFVAVMLTLSLILFLTSMPISMAIGIRKQLTRRRRLAAELEDNGSS